MNAGHLTYKLSGTVRYKGAPPTSSRYMKLSNVPRSTTPADLRRFCAKNKIENTESFILNYERFRPTGTAFISFTKPDFTPNALKVLHGNTLGGSRIEAELVRPHDFNSGGFTRTRGIKGRAEAAERGLFDGTGPNAGLTRNGANVLITGLPGKSTVDIIRTFVRSYKPAGFEDKGDVIKVELPHMRMAVTASFVVRLASVSEAHRLVRNLHMVYYRSDLFHEKYPLRAHVIY
ncbi:hypothetical protein QCA50_002964 [Cerrena zonata]|uniref:RRM domain-containing protein n=1 Tax=Cerrena zonata TaxID=2478898 RepID=A0AAW0GJ71_9APHY